MVCLRWFAWLCSELIQLGRIVALKRDPRLRGSTPDVAASIQHLCVAMGRCICDLCSVLKALYAREVMQSMCLLKDSVEYNNTPRSFISKTD